MTVIWQIITGLSGGKVAVYQFMMGCGYQGKPSECQFILRNRVFIGKLQFVPVMEDRLWYVRTTVHGVVC